MLLTGDSLRWKERAAVWREGWRNLHHPAASLTATFLVEGERGPCVVSRRWETEAAFEAAEVAAQLHDQPRSDLGSLGWTAALRTHRPFLSYNELGSLLDEGPSKLYDALSSILGLEDLVEALGALQEARRSREKALKDATDARGRLLERLRDVDDARARRVAAAIEGKEWDLGAVEEVLGGLASAGDGAAEVDVLRGIASLEPPDPARVAAAVAEMRGAAAAVRSAQETAAARSRDAAALLESALRYHAAHGDGDCPVCGRKGALDGAWSERATRRRGAPPRGGAGGGRRPRAGGGRAAPVGGPGDPEGRRLRAGGRSGAGPRRARRGARGPGSRRDRSADLGALADHVESASGPLREAVVRLRDSARAELGRKEDAWRPSGRRGRGLARGRPRGRARSLRPEAPQVRRRPGSRRRRPGSATTASPPSPRRRPGSGSTSASRATSSWGGSSSPARARGAAWRSTSRSTASRARPSGS